MAVVVVRGGVARWRAGGWGATHWIGLRLPVVASCPPFWRYCSADSSANTRQVLSLGPTTVGRMVEISDARVSGRGGRRRTVIALGHFPEEALGGGRGDLSDHPAPDVGRQPGERSRDGDALRLRGVPDGRAVLRARIAALLVERGGVVELPEEVDKSLEGDPLRVVDHLDRLCVARRARDYRLVRHWRERVAASVAHRRADHTRHALKRELDGPEAPAGEEHTLRLSMSRSNEK